MRLTHDQVGYIAQRVVRGLLKEEMIIADNPEQVIDTLAKVFLEDLEAEERLNEEVREMLKGYADEISRGMLNYQELFRKAKAKMARDRKMII
jgi:hypothetical protein